ADAAAHARRIDPEVFEDGDTVMRRRDTHPSDDPTVLLRYPAIAIGRKLELVGPGVHEVVVVAPVGLRLERELAQPFLVGGSRRARGYDGRSHVSGRRSSAAYSATEPSARRNQTRSKRHSCSHWRQPPHGDAVIAIASTSPGRSPSLAAFAIAARSAQIPSGYAAFSTFA